MKKRIIGIMMVGIMIFGTGTSFAAESDNEKQTQKNSMVECIKVMSESNIIPTSIGYRKVRTVVKTSYRDRVFCGYVTGVWAKASSYHLSKSYSVSTGYSYEGLSLTLGFAKSVAMTIPANSKRYSRLAGYADVKLMKVRYDEYSGAFHYNTYYRAEVEYRDKYFDVKYK